MVAFSLYGMWSTLFSVAALEKRLTAFMGCIMIIGFLTFPASKKNVKPNYLPWYDVIVMLLGAGSFFYYLLRYDYIAMNQILSSESKMTPMFTAVGIVAILCLVELCRRSTGVPILCVAGALVIYSIINLSARTEYPLRSLIYTLFYSTGGVIGTPIQVCAKFIVVFIIFGAFLERTGIAAFFISMANSMVGKYSGGPAKVAVVSSALCGMVSGSSVGNTVTTGSITIPMMKKTGYKPEFAGAVEAAASTGGQIMPPIMGAAAFLMVEYIGEGVTYGQIALKAILPAVLYFTGIFIAVHLEAKKLGLRGIPVSELPRMKDLIKKIYLLAPIILLIILVATGARTMQFAATVSIGATILVNLFDKDNRISVRKILDALAAGGKGAISVSVACSMAGIIAGCLTATGLASTLVNAIVSASNSVQFISPTLVALFLTMLCCIVLGMGVPTTANYCIMASTCAPILIHMGLPRLAAHFFVFYFGIVADITPPVALAAYAGSAIAKSNPMKTGVNATKLAIGAFVVPYIFAMNPAMLFIDTNAVSVIEIIITSFLGMFGLAAALNGYVFRRIPLPVRLVLAAGGLMMMDPRPVTDLIGVGLLAAAFAFQRFVKPKKTEEVKEEHIELPED
jgi:TRAP transporter 4TM/12TM fusion protein